MFFFLRIIDHFISVFLKFYCRSSVLVEDMSPDLKDILVSVFKKSRPMRWSGKYYCFDFATWMIHTNCNQSCWSLSNLIFSFYFVFFSFKYFSFIVCRVYLFLLSIWTLLLLNFSFLHVGICCKHFFKYLSF